MRAMRTAATAVVAGIALALAHVDVASAFWRADDGSGSILTGGSGKVHNGHTKVDVELEKQNRRPGTHNTGASGISADRGHVKYERSGPHYAETVSAEDALARYGTDACVPGTAAVDACGIARQPGKPKQPAASGPRTPTLRDLASFRPATPTLTVEPGGFGIVGRPTNVVASARTQTLTGRLFDLPVTVRFTPAAYRFDYGDGTTRTTPTGGTTWKQGDAPLFTRTTTSHTYTRKAQVTARATIAYTAQVSFTGYPGWYDVTGYVLATTPGHRFPLYNARTVLVEHTCDEDPHGPGCPDTTP